MVTTRGRGKAAPADSSQHIAMPDNSNDIAPTPSTSRKRATQVVTKATTTTSTTISTATATSTATARRTRSTRTADSPLKSLGDRELKRTITRASTSKTTASKNTEATTPATPKRKREDTKKPATSLRAANTFRTTSPATRQADSESDEDGLFFRKPDIPESENVFGAASSESPNFWDKTRAYFRSSPQFPSLRQSTPTTPHVHRREIFQLKARVAELESNEFVSKCLIAKLRNERDLTVKVVNEHLITIDDLQHQIDVLRRNLGLALTRRVEADDICFTQTDYDNSGSAAPEHPPHQPEKGLIATEHALDTLRRIENHGKSRTPRHANGASRGEEEINTPSQHSSHLTASSETSRAAANATPSRPISTPTGFSRFSSALKSIFGFATSTPAPSTAPAPAPSPTPSRVPPPDTYTETLSAPPTPVGENRITREPIVKRRGRRVNPSPMFRLLTKDVPVSEMKAANDWAKQVLPALKNDAAFEEKRKRLETPVLLKDLNNYPPCEPWKSGYGDPLGHLDDEDVVPVWAVYMDMVAEAEQPQMKKTKTSHETSMDVEDTPSLNDTFGSSEPTTPFNSHGTSASVMAINPRSSREPSPMFPIATPQPQGDNIFRKSHEGDVDTSDALNTKATFHHDPAHGSFGLDSDSDEDDSSMLSETSETVADAAPLWTQPPPPAPTPAHAPLPGGLAGETTQQPVGEIERQRQKLMKHTPAKPSRLREAFVPSPSLLSDAGNESILLGTPLAGGDLFSDMPDAEDLGLDDEVMANVARLASTTEWKTRAEEDWAEPLLTYDSEEEALSPVDAQ